jgi:16S rRNA (uracil1498-N3)-methyltransferase
MLFMRLHRFFIEEHLRNKKDITLYDDGIIHQWKDVFRLRPGNQIILLDNSGFEYIAEIVLLAKGKAEVKIIDSAAATNVPQKELWLFAALIKKDNYEWILEKGTELGVSHFVPIVSDRSEKKDLNIERAEKIIKEASEQSGRGTLPMLHGVIDFEKVFSEYKDIPLIAFHLEGEKFDRPKNYFQNNKLGILIGPEGGWSDKELNMFKGNNIPVLTLGPQVLKAETAAIVISALLGM